MTSAKKNSKKWSDEDIDNLIDLYEVNPCLWDIFDKSYQKRDVKEKVLAAIAEELDVEINEIKGKWNAIRGQFGRELHKVKTSKSGQSADDLYVNQWVFWDKLQFLNKVMKTSTKSRDTLSFGAIDTELIAEEDINTADSSIEEKAPREKMPSKAKKRKLEEAKTELLTSCINVMKTPAPATESRVETNHFALHIGAKLNSMTNRQRILAEKRINDIIFEIEIGELQQPINNGNTNNIAVNPILQGPYMSALTNNNINLL